MLVTCVNTWNVLSAASLNLSSDCVCIVMYIVACGTDVVHLIDVTSFLTKVESSQTDVNKWDAFKWFIDYNSEVYCVLWNSCDLIAYINICVGTRSRHVGKGM
jgi:hypothetical protein